MLSWHHRPAIDSHVPDPAEHDARMSSAIGVLVLIGAMAVLVTTVALLTVAGFVELVDSLR